jgi:hypothetical protein
MKLLTSRAGQDEYTAQDYREMYEELREKMSLDRLVEWLGSRYSKAKWSQYERGVAALTRDMKNELRAAHGRPQLPTTVAETTAHASPDASVWLAGAEGEEVTTILMVAGDAQRIVGAVRGVEGAQSAGTKRRRYEVPGRVRPPAVSAVTAARVRCLGVSWNDVLEAGLTVLEKEKK